MCVCIYANSCVSTLLGTSLHASSNDELNIKRFSYFKAKNNLKAEKIEKKNYGVLCNKMKITEDSISDVQK